MTTRLKTLAPIAALALLAGLAAGCKEESAPAAEAPGSSSAASSKSAAPEPAASTPATPPPAKPADLSVLMNPALLNETAPETFTAHFVTTKGEFDIRVTRSWSPNGADRFYNLVKNGFYDDTAFFRVISGFMAQFGIHGVPAIAAKWRAANIQDDPVVKSNTRGMVTYAKSGAPNSRTTQLFINFGNNARLDASGFSPFGVVEDSGMKVVDSLYAGYGEGAPRGRGPEQQLVQSQGNDYLRAQFPEMDYILRAYIVE